MEIGRLKEETEEIRAEIDRANAETERDKQRRGAEVEQTNSETTRLKTATENIGADIDRTNAKTARLKAKTKEMKTGKL